jgi:16S rRNA processing protein RimM
LTQSIDAVEIAGVPIRLSSRDEPRLLEVGRIAKPHGLKGEVIVALSTDRLERMQPGVTLLTPKGPLTIVSAKRHQERWRVQFAGYSDRDAADTLHGLVLHAEAIDDPDAFFVHELIGSRVRQTNGTDLGLVESVEANAAHDMLVLESGVLIPLVFVTERNGTELVVELPEGLLDL